MILEINTTLKNQLYLALHENGVILIQKTINGKKAQAEILLKAIEKILQKSKITVQDLTEIKVENQGNSFTSLRVGISVANALGYALNIPVNSLVKKADQVEGFSIVKPEYELRIN